MAGDWIAMRCDLCEDPATIAIGLALKMNVFEVVGRLHKVWAWADQQSVDGRFNGLEVGVIDGIANCEKFGETMRIAGWVVLEDGGFHFPKFDRWNTETGKQRLLAARRAKRHRASRIRNADRHASVTLPASLPLLSCHPSPDGEEGHNGEEVEELRSKLEGQYEQGAYELIRKLQKFATCSRAKATTMYGELRSPKDETFKAWVAYEAIHGTIAAVGAMQGHSHPSEVREKIPDTVTTDSSRARYAETRHDVVMRKRQEQLKLESAAAASEAVPPPPEFLEAIGKLKRVMT